MFLPGRLHRVPLTPSSFERQKENPKENGDLDPNKKPPYSYVALITMAIKESPERRLQVRLKSASNPRLH